MKAHMAARVTHPTDDLTQPYEDFKRVPLGNEDEQSLTKQDDKTEKRSSRVESCPQEASEKGFRHENINVAADSKESKIRRLQ